MIPISKNKPKTPNNNNKWNFGKWLSVLISLKTLRKQLQAWKFKSKYAILQVTQCQVGRAISCPHIFLSLFRDTPQLPLQERSQSSREGASPMLSSPTRSTGASAGHAQPSSNPATASTLRQRCYLLSKGSGQIPTSTVSWNSNSARVHLVLV